MVADLRRADLTDATLVWVSVSLGRHTLAHGAGTTGAPSGHGGEPVCLPLHEEFLPNGKRLPTGEHGIEGWPDRGRGARPPGSDMGVCDMFGGIERFPVRTNELLSRLRAAAPNDTLNWLRVSDTAERSQVDQRIRHQLHAIVPLLDTFKSEQQPLELIFPRKGPLDTHPQGVVFQMWI
jgi:hypothetical protein